MMQSTNYRSGDAAAAGLLLLGAAIWGIIWYPYRLLEEQGLAGPLATLLTYGLALLLAVLLYRRRLSGQRVDGWLVAIALASGGCNLGYVLATLHGEIMRVLLLFYLAPLWTVLLARGVLGERISSLGLAIVGMSLSGAAIMLWHPQWGVPWPRQGAEWLALATGFLFALSNVLIRRAAHHSVEFKSTAVFVGVIIIALPVTLFDPSAVSPCLDWLTSLLLIGVASLLVAANVIVQHGLARLAASRAIVILTFELPVAALASWWLVDEVMSVRDWTGGALIVVAGLLAAKMES